MTTRRHLTLIGALLAAGALLAHAGAAEAACDAKAALKCKQTISKESTKFLQAKTKILQKCQESVIKDKVADPGIGNRTTFCLANLKTAEAITKAQDKLAAKIAGACCGKSKDCANPADNCSLADAGVTEPVCSSSEGGNAPASACKAVLGDPGDLAECIVCVAEEHADELVTLLYDERTDADPKVKAEKDLVKCQTTLAKETLKFTAAKAKALEKCWAERLKGKHTNTCPAPGDGKAFEAIAKAESKKIAKICKACGGAGKACADDIGPIPGDGLGDDFDAAAIGFVANCPGIIAGSQPGGAVGSLADLIQCVDDQAGKRVDCVSALSNPFQDVFAVCKPEPCQGAGGTAIVEVDYAAGGTTPATVQSVLVYPEDKLNLPGVGEEPSVTARITVQQGGTFPQTNDLNDALIQNVVGLVPFTGTDLYQVEFDNCGAVVNSGELSCIVLDASDELGNALTDVTCSATVLP